jgi:tetratricopeptide (TPR) repeat protein
MDLDPAWRNQALFGMAIAYQGLGKSDMTTALMAKVAPLDHPVFAPAHLFAAKSLLQQPGALPRFFPFARTQLENVLALEPESVEANEILASIYASQNEWELSEKYYSAIVKKKPEYMLVLAGIAKQRRDEKSAKNWSNDALVYFQHAVESSSTDNPKIRLPYLQALMQVNDFDTAKTVLDEGRKLSGDDPYKSVTSAVCSGLARQIAEEQPGNLNARIKLLREGFDANPKDLELFREVLALSEVDGVESQAAGDRILKMLEKNDAWFPLFFVGAKIADNREDTLQRNIYLDKALKSSPQALSTLNNIAASISSSGNKEEMPFALAMMDFALEKAGDLPMFRLNRGILLTYSSRPKEALLDLQFALDHSEDKAPVHRALAEAYTALGMTNLAQDHMRLAAVPPPKADASPTPVPTPGGEKKPDDKKK